MRAIYGWGSGGEAGHREKIKPGGGPGGFAPGAAGFDSDVCVAGNNDCSGESEESTVTWQSDLDVVYSILVHAVDGDVGTQGGLFNLALFSTTPETTTTDATTTAIATN